MLVAKLLPTFTKALNLCGKQFAPALGVESGLMRNHGSIMRDGETKMLNYEGSI